MSKVKKLILFIVYKAGWWGCFDSLYHSLSDDEANECHVIPVPYYDRLKDSNSIDYKKMHYEAELLPKNIPITDYNKYKIKEHHADVIYIHNPYDDQNPANSIDPDYYSGNLKKYTDLLIYIPHMLYIGGLPELMKLSSVYQNADKIILSNEAVKKAFVGIPKEKLEISSSPLVDYIEKLTEIKPDIPIAWKSMLLNRKDFEGKRVILYHLGYSELFYGTDRTIKKIEYIFNYMKSRNDVIFIWRPEPGIEGKLSEFPNNVAEDYLRLRQRFTNEKIGIYDSTDDECVTSVLADAYMGNAHPMMNLFGIQGKPIILLDNECRYLPSDEEMCSVTTMDCSVDGDDIWFVANEFYSLCKMSLTSGETEVISEIPDEQIKGSLNYCGIIKVKDMVYLCPFNSDAFVTYDVKDNMFTKIYLKQPINVNFDYIVPYKEFLFLKAKNYPSIIRYNMITKEFRYYTDWIEELENYVAKEDENEPYFIWGVVVLQERLMLASSKANIVMEFNMETGEHNFHEVGPKGSKYFGMEYDGECFWLIPYNGKDIVRWNYNTGEWALHKEFSNEIEDNVIPYRSIKKHGESLFVFPYRADFGLKIDYKQNKIQKNNFDLSYPEGSYKSEFYQKANTVYTFAKQLDNGLILAEAMYDKSILLIDSETGRIKKFPCRIPLDEVKKIYDNMISIDRNASNYPCCIPEFYGLRVMIDYCSWSNFIFNDNEKSIYYSKVMNQKEKMNSL